MSDLKGYRALVCGGTKGIGKAAAEELGKRGADVTILARTAMGENSISCDMEDIESAEQENLEQSANAPEMAQGMVQ